MDNEELKTCLNTIAENLCTVADNLDGTSHSLEVLTKIVSGLVPNFDAAYDAAEHNVKLDNM